MIQPRDASVANENSATGSLTPGVNVIGYFEGQFGLGEIARKLATALEPVVPVATIPCGRGPLRDAPSLGDDARERAVFETSLLCVNGGDAHVAASALGLDLLARQYSIGVWFWETTAFPAAWRNAFHFVDEVWVASEFVRAVVAAETWKPVYVVPVPFDPPPAVEFTRADLGLPDGYLFLFSFDFLSVLERKNPLGLIEAFSYAFSASDEARLVIKCVNGERRPEALARLHAAAAAHPGVHVVDSYATPTENEAITANCDCYVSLHRSEGLGLTLADAMAHGKPVIATAFSGNLEFMHSNNSYLVPYELTAIPHGSGYPPDGRWAAPDMAAAAKLMRRVYEHPDEAFAVGARARDDLLHRFSLRRTTAFMSDRLEAIRQAREWSSDPGKVDLRVALMQLACELQRGVGASLSASGRRSPGEVARRLLLRALWPHLSQRHRTDQAVLDALSALERSQAWRSSAGTQRERA